MSKKALSRQLHKEADAVESEMAKLGGSLAVDIATQQKALAKMESRRDKLQTDAKSLRFRLEKFIGPDGSLTDNAIDDPEFDELKERYFEVIEERVEADATIQMVVESIAEGQLLRPGGFPTEGAP